MSKQELGFLDVFSIAAGAMISSGIFVLPAIAFGYAGPAMLVSYVMASFLYMPCMFAKAELATAMPKAGGTYFYVERSLGTWAGTMAGFVNWLSISLKAAFALVGIGTIAFYLMASNAEWGMKMIAVGSCVVFAVVNCFSSSHAGKLQKILVFALLGILGFYIVVGLGHVEVERFKPFMPHGFEPVLVAAGMAFVSFGGLTKCVSVAEEVRNPKRNLVYGMFTAYVVVSLLYVLVLYVTIGTMEPEVLANTKSPIATGARGFLGRWGEIMLWCAAMLAYATTGNAGILSASRSPLAMSRDKLIPKVFGKMTAGGTPILSVVFTAASMIAMILFLDIKQLVKTASAIMLFSFVLVNISAIIMRKSGFQSYRPSFRAPLLPWMSGGATIIYIYLIVDMGTFPLLMTFAFFALASLWYLFYVRPRVDKEAVIAYLVRRIIERHVKRSGVEDELRDISLKRDKVDLDWFDGLVGSGMVLDLKEPMNAHNLFKLLAQTYADRVKMDENRLYQMFLEREADTSTVIQPGLAIPHIIADGEGVFELALVRSKEGIVFGGSDEPVTTAFVLMDSMDQRSMHLKAIVAIATIVQQPGFDKRWMDAKNDDQLRDIVLLSHRTRHKE